MEDCAAAGSENVISPQSESNLSAESPVDSNHSNIIENAIMLKKDSASFSSDGDVHNVSNSSITYNSVYGDGSKDNIGKQNGDSNDEYSDLDFKIKSEIKNNLSMSNINRNLNLHKNLQSFGYREQFNALNSLNGNFNIKPSFSNANKHMFNSSGLGCVGTPLINDSLHCPTETVEQYYRGINNKNDVQFRCNMCGKCFTHSCKLQTHQRYHSGEKPFKCIECGKGFTQRAGLMQHHRLHTGEKPFKCQDCGKSFTQLAGAVQHQRTHSGEKPFSCTECGKSFSQRAGLIQHERLHTGEKPFNCLECGKCFTQLAGLNQHMRTHSGEKPFKCHVCGKCYTQHAGLMAHMKSHTNESMTSPTMVGSDLQIGSQNGSAPPSVSSHTSDEINGKVTPSSDNFAPFSPVSVSNFLPQSQKLRNDDLLNAAHLQNLLPNMQFMHSSGALNMFNPAPSQGFSSNRHKMHGESSSGLLSPNHDRGSMMSPSASSNTPKKPKIEKPFKCNICSKAYTQFAGLMIHQASHQPSQTNNLSSSISAAVENIFMTPNTGSEGPIGSSGLPFIPSSMNNPINMAKVPSSKTGHHSGSEGGPSLSHPVLNSPNLLMNVLP